MSVRTYYTLRCLYCGSLYKANRKNRSKYCCDQHGSMYRTHGRNEELWAESELAIGAGEFVFENKLEPKDDASKVDDKLVSLLNTRKLESARRIINKRAHYAKVLLHIYNTYHKQPHSLWTVPLPELLFRKQGYLDALPGEGEVLVCGDFVLEHVSHIGSSGYYQIKPLEQLSQTEFDSFSLQWFPNG